MKIGDVITISGKKYNIRFMWKDYILVSATTADLETLAASTLVFKITENNKVKLVKNQEEIKVVITKLFEAIQGKKLSEDDNR